MHILLAVALLATGHAEGAAVAQEVPAPRESLDTRLKALDAIDLSENPEAKLAEMKALLAEAQAAPKVAPATLATVQANIGGALFYLRRYGEAVEALDAAGAILNRAGLGNGEEAASLLSNTATILADRGDYLGALERHYMALAIRKRAQGERSLEVGSSTFGIGYVLFRQGKVEESLDWLRRGAEMQLEFGAPENPLGVVRQTSYASVLGTAGRYEESIAAARKAADHAEIHLPKNHPTLGIALNNLGKALNESGQFAESVGVFRRALEVRVAAHGEQHPSTAIALKNLSSPLFAIGRGEEAEALLMRAAEIYVASKETADPTALGVIYSSAATMASARGDVTLAETRLRAAIATLEKNAGAGHVALVDPITEIANLLFLQGKVDEALPFAARANDIARAGYPEDHVDRTGAIIVHARLVAAKGDTAAGFAQAETAARSIERRMLDAAASSKDAVTLGPVNRRHLGRFAAFALETGHAQAAFKALQLANLTETAATLSAVAARAATRDPQVADLARALQDRARRGQQLRSEHSKALVAKGQASIERLSGEIAANDTLLLGAEAALDTRFPEYRALSRPAPIELTAYQATLDPGSALIAPFTVDGRLVTVAVTRNGLTWARSEGTERDVADAIRAIRASVDQAGALATFDRRAAHRLYTYLLPRTLERDVALSDTLLLYGGEALASVPLGLLVTRTPSGRDDDPAALRRTAWLIRDKAVAIPMTLARSPEHVAIADTKFLGIGGPTLAPASAPLEVASLFRGGAVNLEAVRNLPSLPNAQRELRSMAIAFGGDSRVIVGDQATEAAVKGLDLENVSVIAFATHGLVNGEMNGLGEPALVFTPPASSSSADDGLLTASEISLLRLSADWIILSACNTAAGANGGSPSYSGLARAFLHAGGRSLLLSHWAVRDDAAARLTVDTVRNSENGQLSRARALQAAMVSLIDDKQVPGGSHPAVWAPFVIVGQ
ncbi:CHAT domain-containing protein [Sphingomonas sp. M1-B02]|uniref:CHAT domain-containing protein n=1 Tax=Sphingomonas sp. M1-B02 TaxID=3114300 RepID=UPI00223EFBE3|nr:CHAT domain-containing protein [Sphingomonas sp. S6-11]UZK67488.1 CHAT domain-containing protein [Sphingomonas sp. S6-11]